MELAWILFGHPTDWIFWIGLVRLDRFGLDLDTPWICWHFDYILDTTLLDLTGTYLDTLLDTLHYRLLDILDFGFWTPLGFVGILIIFWIPRTCTGVFMN